MHFFNAEAMFPDATIPQFRTSLQSLRSQLRTLGYRLLTSLALDLELDSDFFNKSHQNDEIQLRSLFYPPYPSEPGPNVTRSGPHTDWGTMTLLVTDGKGLEIRARDGEYIRVQPEPGCLVFNAADLLEIWTAGTIPSPMQRVVFEEKSEANQAIALSFMPDFDFIVKPVMKGKKNYDAITPWEYLQKNFNASFKDLKQ